MCFGRQGFQAAVQGQAPRNDAPTVTGRQRGVTDPIDTSKVTARLKKRRQDDRYAQGLKNMSAKGRSPNDLKITAANRNPLQRNIARLTDKTVINSA